MFVGYFGARIATAKIAYMRSRFVILVVVLFSAQSFAWGPEGHRLVADIARSRLSSTARLHVEQLLGDDDLAAISTWADDVRRERPESYDWHFVDIPMDASGFSEPRDCYRPDPKYPSSIEDHHNCVVDRITMFKQVLADPNAPKPERVEALKFLVHFVGDIHQPLHAIGEARGGNDIHVIEFGASQCGRNACNLHYAWDIGLIEHAGLREMRYAAELNRLIAKQNLARRAMGTPADWANESFGIAKKVWLPEGGAVDEKYYSTDIGIVNQQLALAGLRLAAMLNQSLGK
jgi:hypothetical protein